MPRLARFIGSFLLALGVATRALAGGSGLNVIVVINENSPNSLRIGNEYCEQRGVPPQNVLRMKGWTGGAVTWSRADFENRLLNPLLAMVASRSLTNQATFVLLSMDIPYRVADGASQNSTTSALFYGFKTNSVPPENLPVTCSLPDASANSYAFSELPFRLSAPDTAPTNSFLAMMLTDTTPDGASAMIRQGVASDSTFPAQAVYLAKTSDSARNVRYIEFDEAIFNTRIRGDFSLTRVDTDSTAFTNILGLLTGRVTFSLPGNAFAPGALADNLTSYGGLILEYNDQTSLLAFLHAGAGASYGTVVEPCNYTEKFPHPLDYFFQNRGFNIAESYYQSLLNPYQGLMVGEPLAAPFAMRAELDWRSPTNGATLIGPATIELTFNAGASNAPLDTAELFVDGTFFQTLNQLTPASGNVLSVSINSSTINYIVPADSSIWSVASNISALLNAQSATTHVQAYPVGDRIELQGLDVTTAGSNLALGAMAAIGTGSALTTGLFSARTNFLDTTAIGNLSFETMNSPALGDWLQLDLVKTNGTQVTISVTNATAGTTIGALTQNLFNQINATPALQGADGVLASDFAFYSEDAVAVFTLNARSPGWPAAQIQATLTCSTGLDFLPAGSHALEDNLQDLRPRNHLYVTAGLTEFPTLAALDTTRLPDGYHELTVVGYQGDSVRTQTRASRSVQVRNHSLDATLSCSTALTNIPLDTPLSFTVTGNDPGIASVELFSTGGSAGVVSNLQTAVFTINPTTLGLGLHPFYALVTDSNGLQFRTETLWLRFIPTLKLAISQNPLALSWDAAPGVVYEVLVATNLASTFDPAARVTATSSTAQWLINPAPQTASFYLLRVAQP